MKTWPYKGPVAIAEKDTSGAERYLLVDNWCVIGVADSEEEISATLDQKSSLQIDRDTYRYLVATVFSKDSSLIIKTISKNP